MKGFLITVVWYFFWFGLITVVTGCADYPIAVRIQGQHGTYGYSAKGITIDINTTNK